MGIILEFKDYSEVHEALDMVNEGLLGNIWNKLKDMFKGISGKVDETIVGPEIDKMFDPKTGELTPELLEVINSINPQPAQGQTQQQTPDQAKAALAEAFKKIQGYAGKGWYFQQSLKFMQDGMALLMDQAAADKAGAGAAAKTAAQKPAGAGGAQAQGMEKVASEEMEKRAKDFDATYKKAKDNLKAQVKAKMAELQKKSSAESTKLYINNRFSTCETVLLLIEYNIKKLRLGLKGVEELKKQMTESYKASLNSAKALQAAVEKAKTEGGMTVDTFKNLDINGFVKEFPPSELKVDAEGKVTEPADAKELFVYPYLEDKLIVITGLDVNKKTVTFRYVDKNMKFLDDPTEPVQLDQFKENLLEANEQTPPLKQKGADIGKAVEAKKKEEAAAASASGGQANAQVAD